MSIEEGVRSILTSGIATGEQASGMTGRTMGDLETIADFETLQNALVADPRSAGEEADAEADDD